MQLSPAATLPTDQAKASLIGRVFRPDVGGPSVVAVRGGILHDITSTFATVRDLTEAADPHDALTHAKGTAIGPLDAILANTLPDTRDVKKPWLLAPVDLQAIKAAGVTFAFSMIERVIEEQASGDASKSKALRAEITTLVGDDLSKVKPGSPDAMRLKAMLQAKGAWSQYLEVGIGPDAEIFTKSPVLSAMGTGADVGIHPISKWNNPEPEVVLVVASSGKIIGAALGNDVNLRDVEGRSALLLGKAKDNNASCAIGPFIRLFDKDFGLDDVRGLQIQLTVDGPDGYHLSGGSNMRQISRDPADLASQMIGRHHQYPDGAVLFCGTMFAPVDDRGEAGKGFTHHIGDIVTVSNPRLGALTNRVKLSTECPPWTFGISDLMRNLAGRGVLAKTA
jgi:fumarylacetoacetate (FAA) hydrolase family protein